MNHQRAVSFETQRPNFPMPRTVARSEDEVKVALSFVQYGYGMRVLREQIQDYRLSPTRYNNLITLIMKNTFRVIEAAIGPGNKRATVSHLE